MPLAMVAPAITPAARITRLVNLPFSFIATSRGPAVLILGRVRRFTFDLRPRVSMVDVGNPFALSPAKLSRRGPAGHGADLLAFGDSLILYRVGNFRETACFTGELRETVVRGSQSAERETAFVQVHELKPGISLIRNST